MKAACPLLALILVAPHAGALAQGGGSRPHDDGSARHTAPPPVTNEVPPMHAPPGEIPGGPVRFPDRDLGRVYVPGRSSRAGREAWEISESARKLRELAVQLADELERPAVDRRRAAKRARDLERRARLTSGKLQRNGESVDRPERPPEAGRGLAAAREEAQRVRDLALRVAASIDASVTGDVLDLAAHLETLQRLERIETAARRIARDLGARE